MLSCYFALALAYRDAIPLFEAPDEPSHLHYAAFVHSHGRLPRERPLDVPGEGMQPPLVYVIAAPLLGAVDIDVAWAERQLRRLRSPNYPSESYDGLEPSDESQSAVLSPHGRRFFFSDGSFGPLRIARSTSLAFGLLAVLFTFCAARRVSHDAALPLLAASLLAFNPQFLFSSGYFSNDPAAAAVGAAALWVVVRALEDPQRAAQRRDYAALALVVALGLLTKLSTLPALAVAAVTVAAVDRRGLRARLPDLALAAAIVLLLAGPYYIWAAQHRGGFLGTRAVLASASGMLPVKEFAGLQAYLSDVYWYRTLESYWARFGWFNVRVPAFVHFSFFALSAAGIFGVLRSPLPAQRVRIYALRRYLIATVLVTLAAHLAMNLVIVSPQGRQLFGSAPQLALLLALGVHRLPRNERRRMPLALIIVAAMIALDLYCWAVLVAAYR